MKGSAHFNCTFGIRSPSPTFPFVPSFPLLERVFFSSLSLFLFLSLSLSSLSPPSLRFYSSLAKSLSSQCTLLVFLFTSGVSKNLRHFIGAGRQVSIACLSEVYFFAGSKSLPETSTRKSLSELIFIRIISPSIILPLSQIEAK